jgi:hypothetical protein
MWTSPDNGLWVARTREAYLGMVETTTTGFSVTDAQGSDLGAYDNLDTAKNIIAMDFDGVPRDSYNSMTPTVLVAIAAASAAVSMVVGYIVLSL